MRTKKPINFVGFLLYFNIIAYTFAEQFHILM